MKILYFITKSEAGGAQTHIYQLSRYFVRKRDEVAIMSYPGGWLEKEAKELGVKFYPNECFSNQFNPIRIFKAMRKIKKTADDFKPDLVSCHSTTAGFLVRLVIKNKIPTIFTVHGWAFTKGAPFLRKCLAILVEKIAGKFCSKIICVSNFDRNLALKYKVVPLDKITVIHNGVETQNGADIKQNDTEWRGRQAENRGKEMTKIVFVGRLAQQKDPLLLLKSFNDLSSELKDKSQIFIIGDGSKKKELEEFIKKNKLEEKIKLLGSISREKVFETLRKSDIFVLISNWEEFPYTIIEAMSCGLAVIASEVGGIREAISGDCGILVKRSDKEGIKNALEKLIKNPSLIREMGENARERARKEFSLDKMLKETEKVYKSIVPFKK